MQTIRYQKRPEVLNLYAVSNSTLCKRVSDGLFPPPIPLGGARAVGWLEHETNQVLAAMAAGKTASEVRKLVKDLVHARKTLSKTGGV